MSTRLNDLLLRLFSPDVVERQLAADESTDQRWVEVELLILCRALVRLVLGEDDEGCREAQLHALVTAVTFGGSLDYRSEFLELVGRLPAESDSQGYLEDIRELIETEKKRKLT